VDLGEDGFGIGVRAKKTIKKGQEIFCKYPYNWRDDVPSCVVDGNMLIKDYSLRQRHGGGQEGVVEDQSADAKALMELRRGDVVDTNAEEEEEEGEEEVAGDQERDDDENFPPHLECDVKREHYTPEWRAAVAVSQVRRAR
jgi:hypothetical protein